jgi:ElaB/YqjD/DUF883 family membrane-anchored ribosome-binding protein
MQVEIAVAIASALLSLIGGKAVLSNFIENFIRKLLGRKKPEISYSEKLAELTSNLTKASEEMDSVLAEVAKVTGEREKAMKNAEVNLQTLQTTEKELQDRIAQLKDVPLPVAEYFAQLTSTGEKRGARRDYLLFGSGVVVSTLIAIGLKLLGWG